MQLSSINRTFIIIYICIHFATIFFKFQIFIIINSAIIALVCTSEYPWVRVKGLKSKRHIAYTYIIRFTTTDLWASTGCLCWTCRRRRRPAFRSSSRTGPASVWTAAIGVGPALRSVVRRSRRSTSSRGDGRRSRRLRRSTRRYRRRSATWRWPYVGRRWPHSGRALRTGGGRRILLWVLRAAAEASSGGLVMAAAAVRVRLGWTAAAGRGHSNDGGAGDTAGCGRTTVMGILIII